MFEKIFLNYLEIFIIIYVDHTRINASRLIEFIEFVL